MDTNLISILEQLALLMEILGENDFRISALKNGTRALEQSGVDVRAALEDGSLTAIRGIGKGLQELIKEYVHTGTIAEYNDLKSKIPAGVLQLTELRGVGGKKAKALYEQLNITSIGELEYACKENRLIELKGFGAKTQASILQSIEQWHNAQGKMHMNKAWLVYAVLEQQLLDAGAERVEASGELRRGCEIVTHITAVADCEDPYVLAETLEADCDGDTIETVLNGMNILVHCTNKWDFADVLFRTTGSDDFVSAFTALPSVKAMPQKNTEQDIFAERGVQYITPELREDVSILTVAQQAGIPDLIEPAAMRGMLHIHTRWSDGMNSVREMALEAKRLGFTYIAICDHSKTAVYANGLSIERVLQQHDEIDAVNAEGLGITVLKGIESDILPDGSLDYPDDILQRFDMVVASVHSAFRLPKEQQTERIIAAIRNPYTTILGHPTGRLLLARDGYEIDMERIIDAAAETGTVIELNANPYRLDLDWRWHAYAVQKGVRIGINPDSHETATLSEVWYGVTIARKGMLTETNVINTLGLEDFRQFAATLRQNKLNR